MGHAWTPRLNLPFLHFLLCAENLAHTSLPWPNLLDAEVEGLHKTRQMQFGKGRTRRGSARDIAGLCSSKDGAEMGQTSQSMAEGRGMMSSNLPLPQQGLCVHILSTESSFALASHFLPSTNFIWLLWVQADEELRMLSQKGRDNHSHQNTCHSPGSPPLLHSPQRRFSPLLPPDSLGAAWFTSYGDVDGD